MAFFDFTADDSGNSSFFRIIAFSRALVDQKVRFDGTFFDDRTEGSQVAFENGNATFMHISIFDGMNDFVVEDLRVFDAVADRTGNGLGIGMDEA